MIRDMLRLTDERPSLESDGFDVRFSCRREKYSVWVVNEHGAFLGIKVAGEGPTPEEAVRDLTLKVKEHLQKRVNDREEWERNMRCVLADVENQLTVET